MDFLIAVLSPFLTFFQQSFMMLYSESGQPVGQGMRYPLSRALTTSLLDMPWYGFWP